MERQDFESWNEALFRKYASQDRYVHPNFLIRKAANMRADSIVRALAPRAGDSVLDIGCGSGHVMARIARISSGHVTGIDLSDSALELAGRNVSSQRNISLLKADAQKLPFPDSSFDRVVCADVLEHVPEPEKAVREIFRVSKPGARVVVVLPNEALQARVIRIASKLGFSGALRGTDTHREWHIHDSGESFFRQVNNGFLSVDRVVRSPAPFFPLTFIFVCRSRKRAG